MEGRQSKRIARFRRRFLTWSKLQTGYLILFPFVNEINFPVCGSNLPPINIPVHLIQNETLPSHALSLIAEFQTISSEGNLLHDFSFSYKTLSGLRWSINKTTATVRLKKLQNTNKSIISLPIFVVFLSDLSVLEFGWLSNEIRGEILNLVTSLIHFYESSDRLQSRSPREKIHRWRRFSLLSRQD